VKWLLLAVGAVGIAAVCRIFDNMKHCEDCGLYYVMTEHTCNIDRQVGHGMDQLSEWLNSPTGKFYQEQAEKDRLL
jgi:hypothetical protein